MKNQSRYFRIAKLIKQLIKQGKAGKYGQKYLAEFLQAPLFTIELDPISSLQDLQKDQLGAEKFFGLPYQNFILDFPPLENVRDKNFTPLLFVRTLDGNTIYVQDLELLEGFDAQLWIDQNLTPDLVGVEISNWSNQAKLDWFSSHRQKQQLIAEKFVFQSTDGDWTKPRAGLDTYGNIVCPYERKEFFPGGHSDLTPYFLTCEFQTTGKGCKGQLDQSCQMAQRFGQQIYSLLFYALVYINYPANIIIEEAEELTPREQRQLGKRQDVINPKKPRLRVIDHKEIIRWKRSGTAGIHASPIPHLRKGHWRSLKDERFKKQDIIWIRQASVGGELAWQQGKTKYQVVEPPSRKYEF